MMDTRTGIVWSGPSGRWHDVLPPLLDDAGLIDALAGYQQVLIKPNLVEALEPPITTPAELVCALVDYLQDRRDDLDIIVGEGTGSLDYETGHCFDRLGYTPLGGRRQVELLDLNNAPCRRLTNQDCTRWPEIHLPRILFETFLISVPVLKAHSMSGVTLTMKNMMGCAPPAHYQAGGWGKSAFHRQLDQAVFDLNRYRTPDFTVLDASVGMARAHLWGPTCSPPVGKLAVGHDPVAIDAYGTSLLQRSWRDIDHIRRAHQVLGSAEHLDIRSPALPVLR
ncbi:MAG: DUF362 domain-containing protein [Desulfobulbaceae bacterium]|nr:DUF362 domain-containing protein [Desulfobulbaceae bacterium]